VEEDHGRELSLKVARELVMFLKRPGGLSQFSTHLAAQAPAQSTIRAVQDYVLGSLKADFSVTAPAARARMGEPHGRYDPGMNVWVRPGWVSIVQRAAADLHSIGVDLIEAREKLGQLRLHVPAKDVRRADVRKIFRVAGERAARTCDICGNPGRFLPEA
jgi:hypothetical protein